MLEGGSAALPLVGTVVAGTAGMGWLALAMDVHWRQVRGDALRPAAALRLRMLGVFCLIAALALCLWMDHASMAVLVWIMVMTASALIVALVLTWRPRWLSVLAWAGELKK